MNLFKSIDTDRLVCLPDSSLTPLCSLNSLVTFDTSPMHLPNQLIQMSEPSELIAFFTHAFDML